MTRSVSIPMSAAAAAPSATAPAAMSARAVSRWTTAGTISTNRRRRYGPMFCGMPPAPSSPRQHAPPTSASTARSIPHRRGCEHGCIYCFARPTHAYLGLSPGLDFESKIFAKPNAAQAAGQGTARAVLPTNAAPWPCGTNTDPYRKPVGAHPHGITRSGAREVLARFHLSRSASSPNRRWSSATSTSWRRWRRESLRQGRLLSVTSLDHLLARKMEPRKASTPGAPA